MKSSAKILIGVIIAISFFLGFFIGMTVNSNKSDKQELAGTIGKSNDFRDIKATESDIHLRSDLLSNEALLKSYRKYFTFHYSSCEKLCKDIDFTIQTAENITEFREDYSMEIENVKQYRKTLGEAQKSILLATTSLQKLAQSDDSNFSQVINNASIAVTQIKDKQKCLQELVGSIEKFMSGNNPYKFSELIKAHDMFAINQLVVAP
jgi:hypothetical protein